MHKWKAVVGYIKSMSDLSYTILKCGVVLSCLFLFGAVVTMIAAADPNGDFYELFHIAHELKTLPQAILLVTILLSAVAEDRFTER